MHINFCETILKSVVRFSDPLAKSYAQKNEILAEGLRGTKKFNAVLVPKV